MFLRSLTTEAMGTGGLREHSLSHSDKVNRRSAQLMRAQNPLSAQLVPIYRGQPACEQGVY